MARTPISEEHWKTLAEAAHYHASELAKLCNLSIRQVQREFRRVFNQSPQEWLDKQRIKAAEQLLLSGLPVKNVASELGYKQSSHFCRHFKEQNNLTPSQFIVLALTADSCRSQITKCRSQIIRAC